MTAKEIYLFVVPYKKRQAALDACHRELGHQGRDRTLSLMQERFWWPKMRVQTVMQLRGCQKCAWFEAKPSKPPMVPIVATEAARFSPYRFCKDGIDRQCKGDSRDVKCSGCCGPLHPLCAGICDMLSWPDQCFVCVPVDNCVTHRSFDNLNNEILII